MTRTRACAIPWSEVRQIMVRSGWASGLEIVALGQPGSDGDECVLATVETRAIAARDAIALLDEAMRHGVAVLPHDARRLLSREEKERDAD